MICRILLAGDLSVFADTSGGVAGSSMSELIKAVRRNRRAIVALQKELPENEDVTLCE